MVPTYNDRRPLQEYLQAFEHWFSEVYRVLRSDGRLCLNLPKAIKDEMGNTYSVAMHVMPILKSVGYEVAGEITWLKARPEALPAGTAWGSWLSASAPDFRTTAEHIYVLHKGTWKRNAEGESTIDKETFLSATTDTWMISHDAKEHPAQFPYELVYRCIQLLSYKGDVVLDPFCGRGTTCEVANNCGRIFIGSEINPQFAAIAQDYVAQEGIVEGVTWHEKEVVNTTPDYIQDVFD
jgi:DNA modification methylase